MQKFKTLIIRHNKENKKKCTLEPLRHNSNFSFYNYPLKRDLPNLSSYLLLSFDGPELSQNDRDCGLILIDGTWRYTTLMENEVFKSVDVKKRSLPKKLLTAYPRRQEDCEDPNRGLASIEALYVSYRILGWDYHTLLDNYHFRELFLEKNKVFFDSL